MNFDRRRALTLSQTSLQQRSRGVFARCAVRLTLAGWLAISLVAACSDSETASTTEQQAPPSVSITRITPVGAPAWQPGASCVEVGHDAEGSVAVSVALSDAELRAPGACGARGACGHLVFSVQNSAGFSSTSASSSPGHTFSMQGAATGLEYEFSVALVDDEGEALLVGVVPVAGSASLTLAAPGDCGGQPLQDAGTDAQISDASADAAGDASSDAASDAAGDATPADAASDATTADAASDAPSGDAAADAG